MICWWPTMVDGFIFFHVEKERLIVKLYFLILLISEIKEKIDKQIKTKHYASSWVIFFFYPNVYL